MNSPDLVTLALVASVLGSAFFSGCETGLMTVSPVRLHRLLQAGDARASNLGRWLERLDDGILTCLVGTNLCNVAASAITTAVLSAVLGARGEGLAVLAASLALVVFGEILPKVLYREYPEQLTIRSLPLLGAFRLLISPVRWLLGGYARLLQRLDRADDQTPRQERAALTSLLASSQPNPRDRRFRRGMHRFLRLSHRRVTDLMRPRADLVTITRDLTLTRVLEIAARSGYSRLPVQGTRGDLIGYVLVRDLLLAEGSEGHQAQLPGAPVPSGLVRPLLLVDASLSPYELFEELHARGAQLAAVVDAAGRSLGIVTLEDLIEKVTGAIADEFDQPEETT
jgi:putative hemolysin